MLSPEREGERKKTERERDREGERERERERKKERKRGESVCERETERQSDRQTDRQTDRHAHKPSPAQPAAHLFVEPVVRHQMDVLDVVGARDRDVLPARFQFVDLSFTQLIVDDREVQAELRHVAIVVA